jgi:hypothetical protein
MNDMTAEHLLASVGITPDSDYPFWPKYLWYDNPAIYIGPKINSTELDAILLVAGQKLIANADSDFVLQLQGNLCGWGRIMTHNHPGHVLARAIAEVRG